MEVIIGDFLKIILPAGLVLLGMYLMAESILKKQFEKHVIDLRNKNAEIVLPVRLQAYERMALFLERISPHNLILRINQPNMTSAELQQQMLIEIREELNHNLSQQIYMTDVTWTLIRNASEEVVAAINTASQTIEPESPSIELARRIFENQMNKTGDAVQRALLQLKEEIGMVF